jgi:hypothetical protein
MLVMGMTQSARTPRPGATFDLARRATEQGVGGAEDQLVTSELCADRSDQLAQQTRPPERFMCRLSLSAAHAVTAPLGTSS